MREEPLFSIKVVAKRTGLTPHVIRAWEKRYQAITPTRTRTKRRLYSETDIERLLLLRRAKELGYSLKQVARLPTEKLLTMVNVGAYSKDSMEAQRGASITGAGLPKAQSEASAEIRSPQSDLEAHVNACLSNVEELDAEGLKETLARAMVALGWPTFLDGVLIPLMHRIGECWRQGSLRIAHEHLASAVVRAFLESIQRSRRGPTSAPKLIATTPTGQLHELGALAAAAIAAMEGWYTIYLGPNLPAEEIANAALQCRAKVVTLSIVYPTDDPYLPLELEELRQYLPYHVAILVGGRAAHAYAETLERIGAVIVSDWLSFRRILESLRVGHPAHSD